MALGGCIARYSAEPTFPNLFAILGLPKLTLRTRLVRGKFSHDHMISTIRVRIQKFVEGNLAELWAELLQEMDRLLPRGAETRHRKRARRPDDADAIPATTLRRMRQLVGDGASRKAMDVLLTPGSHDPNDPQVLARLRALNPAAAPANLSAMPACIDPLLGEGQDEGFWERLVRESILHFPRGSSGGPSGLRPSHLQDALKRRAGSMSLILALAGLAKRWVDGTLPPEHAPYWCGANLTPLCKPDGGVRPVAVGETIRRLVGKALLATGVSKAQVAQLAPVQVGVGVRSAAESVAMGLQSIVDSLSHTMDLAILNVDLCNAFNSVDRLAMLKAASQCVPSVYNYLRYAYSAEAPLYVGDTCIPSQKGTHQGCPLGPLGFALAIQPLLEQTAKPGNLVWSSWYLDVGVLVGTPAQILGALKALQQGFAKISLSVNVQKCETWGPAAPLVRAALPDITLVPWAPDKGITVLGCPVNFPGSTANQEKGPGVNHCPQ